MGVHSLCSRCNQRGCQPRASAAAMAYQKASIERENSNGSSRSDAPAHGGLDLQADEASRKPRQVDVAALAARMRCRVDGFPALAAERGAQPKAVRRRLLQPIDDQTAERCAGVPQSTSIQGFRSSPPGFQPRPVSASAALGSGLRTRGACGRRPRRREVAYLEVGNEDAARTTLARHDGELHEAELAIDGRRSQAPTQNRCLDSAPRSASSAAAGRGL